MPATPAHYLRRMATHAARIGGMQQITASTPTPFADTNIAIYAEESDADEAQRATTMLEAGPVISSRGRHRNGQHADAQVRVALAWHHMAEARLGTRARANTPNTVAPTPNYPMRK